MATIRVRTASEIVGLSSNRGICANCGATGTVYFVCICGYEQYAITAGVFCAFTTSTAKKICTDHRLQQREKKMRTASRINRTALEHETVAKLLKSTNENELFYFFHQVFLFYGNRELLVKEYITDRLMIVYTKDIFTVENRMNNINLFYGSPSFTLDHNDITIDFEEYCCWKKVGVVWLQNSWRRNVENDSKSNSKMAHNNEQNHTQKANICIRKFVINAEGTTIMFQQEMRISPIKGEYYVMKKVDQPRQYTAFALKYVST